MAGRLILPIAEPVLDDDALPDAGAQLFCYEAGTTTLADWYSDEALTVPILNPQVADAAGRLFVQGTVIWLGSGVYDLKLVRTDGSFNVFEGISGLTGDGAVSQYEGGYWDEGGYFSFPISDVPDTADVADAVLEVGQAVWDQDRGALHVGDGTTQGGLVFFPDTTSSDPFFGPFLLHKAFDGFRQLDNPAATGGGSTHNCIALYGDSMASPNYALGFLTREFQMTYGQGGLFSPGFGQTWLGAAWNLTGGASQALNDFTWFPGANQIHMPAGSSANTTLGALAANTNEVNAGVLPLEYSEGIPPDDVTQVEFYYLTRPGDGTLTFQVTQAGLTYAPVVVNCNAALGLQRSIVAVQNPGKFITAAATATVAGCIFVGALFRRPAGVLAMLCQVGGTSMAQQNLYITNGNYTGPFTTLCNFLGVSLFVHSQRAGTPADPNYQANFDQVFDALDTLTNASQLVLGEAPSTDLTLNPSPADANLFLFTAAQSRRYGYIDQSALLGGSIAAMPPTWYDGDGIHLDPPANRFLAGRISQAVDHFRSGSARPWLYQTNAEGQGQQRFSLTAFSDSQSAVFSGNGQSTLIGGVNSGVGWAYAGSNEGGYSFTGGTVLGYSVGRISAVPSNTSIATASSNYAFSIIGYRNITLTAGNRAHVMFGVSSTLTTLVGLSQISFGVEFAKGTDVGSPLVDSLYGNPPTPVATTAEVMRLIAYDGASIKTSEWVNVVQPGASPASQSGLKLSLIWDRLTGRLSLYANSSVFLVRKKAVLDLPLLKLTNLASAFITTGLLAEDGANIPVAASDFSIKEIRARWNDSLPYPWSAASS